MPTYAIIGASKQTGIALLGLLLKDSANKINCYLSSKATLLSKFPIIEQDEAVKIFYDSYTNIPSLASCISNVDAIFLVAGEQGDPPNGHTAQIAAQSLVAALCHLGLSDGATKLPKVIALNRCPGGEDPPMLCSLLNSEFPIADWDLALAKLYLGLHESWLRVWYVQAGGLVKDGHRIPPVPLWWRGVKCFVTFEDLAARMIDIARCGDCDGVDINVVPTSDNAAIERRSPKQMAWVVAPWVLAWLVDFWCAWLFFLYSGVCQK